MCNKERQPERHHCWLDHNLDFLKADRHNTTNEFIQCNLDFGLIPTITRPTRITKTSATLIDNIIVSQNLCGSFISSILVNDTSDNLPTVCVLDSLKLSKKEPMVIRSRDTRTKNVEVLNRQLRDHDWSEDLSDPSPSKNMEKIHSTLGEIIGHCIPIRE